MFARVNVHVNVHVYVCVCVEKYCGLYLQPVGAASEPEIRMQAHTCMQARSLSLSLSLSLTHTHTHTHTHTQVGAASESGETPKSVHVKVPGDRWEIVVAVSDGQFQQVLLVKHR